MIEKFSQPLSAYQLKKNGEVKVSAPSNIALVKYWGKMPIQIPANPSISFTLNACKTETILSYRLKEEGEEQEITVFLDGEKKDTFVPKIQTFLNRIKDYCPFVESYHFTIDTHNTFPHSSGIASSASGMSALARAITMMEENLGGQVSQEKTSFLARLGSGSACRSVYRGLVIWGTSEEVINSTDLYAIPLEEEIAPIFKNFKDCILLIHEGQKKVSSSAGHHLMNNHPYAAQRFKEAKANCGKLIEILKEGNVQKFGELIEHEALSLHAVMLMSHPPYILMEPHTISVIQKVWEFRENTQLPLYFTLDAGANVHLLYPAEQAKEIETFIREELLKFTASNKAIWDDVSF